MPRRGARSRSSKGQAQTAQQAHYATQFRSSGRAEGQGERRKSGNALKALSDYARTATLLSSARRRQYTA
eukprot:9033460-Pyramimonas_sp.AAC.1